MKLIVTYVLMTALLFVVGAVIIWRVYVPSWKRAAFEQAKIALQHQDEKQLLAIIGRDRNILSDTMPDTQKTLLHYAIQYNYYNGARVLLHEGANPNAQDRSGWTAMHYCVRLPVGQNHDSVRYIYLLKKYGGIIDERTDMRETPLFMAAQVGDIPAIKTFIALGANIEAKDIFSKFTPFLISVECDNIEAMKVLISLGANIRAVDFENNNALHFAVLSKNIPICRYLISRDKSLLYRKNRQGRNQLSILQSVINL